MAKDFSRANRVGEQMQRELADLLMFEVKDPRIGMITLTEVEVSGDMAHAKVYYSASKALPEIQKGLEKCSGFLRTQLSKRMMLRTVPQLHFVYDDTIDNGMKIASLIEQARGSDQAHSEQTTDTASDKHSDSNNPSD